MAFAPDINGVLFRRQIIFASLAKYQPWLFGLGMMVFTLAMMGAGTLGVQRRHWDMAFTNSALGYDYPASAYTLMGIVGISGVAAIVGGALFVAQVVGSLLFGKRVGSESAYSTTSNRLLMPTPTPAPDHAAIGKWGFAAPGTFLLAILFLSIFVFYYAVNWKYLASVWPMS